MSTSFSFSIIVCFDEENKMDEQMEGQNINFFQFLFIRSTQGVLSEVNQKHRIQEKRDFF